MVTTLNETLMSASRQAAYEGMSMVRPYHLFPGTIIYRFIDITRAPGPVQAANGPWWLEYEAFQQIKHFATRGGYPLEYSARLHTAVLYEWNEVSGYARAQVLKPISAWKGRGKQVLSKNRDRRDLPAMTPLQSVQEIYQLYIPGLRRDSPLFATALKFLEWQPC